MHDQPSRQHHGRRWPPVAALLAVITLALSSPAPSAAGERAGAGTAEGAPERAKPAADKEPVCVYGCERWGKFCNVDPRGVYKCRRRCEKFGEICE